MGASVKKGHAFTVHEVPAVFRTGLSAAMKAMEEGNELHTALLALARRGLHSMQGET